MSEIYPFHKALEENRIGLVPMTRSIMQQHADLAAEIQARLLVWDVQARFYADRIDIVAYSPDFEPQEKGLMMPTYEVIITEHRDDEGEIKSITWDFRQAGYDEPALVEGAPV